MLISIYRYIPGHDDSPRMQDYHLDLDPQQDLMVLDVLELLKEQDETLAYRRSCREGVCGSDGMNINGVNTLACITKVSTFLWRLQSFNGGGRCVIDQIRPDPFVLLPKYVHIYY